MGGNEMTYKEGEQSNVITYKSKDGKKNKAELAEAEDMKLLSELEKEIKEIKHE